MSSTGDFHPTYKTKAAYPNMTPSVTIYFDGLLCVCFDGETLCTVGVNNQSPLHKLNFGIWNASGCERLYPAPNPPADAPPPPKEIWINVINPVPSESGVHVYDPAPGTPPVADRYSYVDYCLDLEGPKLHNSPVPKQFEHLWPRFYIDNGLVCAYKLSQCNFALKMKNGQHEIGQIALGAVADIFLQPEGSIEFRADGETTPFFTLGPWRDGDSYEIAITNSCVDCAHNPASTVKTERNDFYLHYLTVKVAEDEQFELVAEPPYGSSEAVKLGQCIKAIDDDDHHISPSAPCQWLGYGQTLTLGSAVVRP